jgi:hypothetical protein
MTQSQQPGDTVPHPQPIAQVVRSIAIHHAARNLQPPCSIATPGCASRHTGAVRRFAMELIGIVMLTAIVLYMCLQVQDLTS